jgi:hypothetical protein
VPRAAGEVPSLIPFGPQAKKALELTFREALCLGHNYIGTEHILLALLELEDGSGILTGLGLDKTTTETNVTDTRTIVEARGLRFVRPRSFGWRDRLSSSSRSTRRPLTKLAPADEPQISASAADRPIPAASIYTWA